MLFVWTARLPVVDGKGPQNLAILRSNWRGPTGPETMPQGQLAKICPQRIVGNVRNHNLSPAKNRSATRSLARSNLKPIYGLAIFLRKTRRSTRSQSDSITLQQKY